MDAFAVALASGIAMKNVSFRQTFRLAWHFGLFQSLMPIMGWSLGLSISGFLQTWDHWIAFVILDVIGVKMILDALHSKSEEIPQRDPTKGLTMVMLSVATSIDAFAIGLSMCMLQISIWMPALIIGIVACLLTALGLHLGRWMGSRRYLANYAEALGGMILVAIGVNILREHNAVFSIF